MEQNNDKVQEVEQDLDIDYEAQLAAINRALEENARQMAEIDKALSEMTKRKIFTIKELKEMELEKQRKAREKLENEKREIDNITATALEEAEILRNSAKNEDEKIIFEDKAINMELKAILHDLEIRKMILSENESKLEDVLADLAIAESEFERNKRSSLTASKKSGEYYNLREEIYRSKSRKSLYFEKYREIAKVVEKQTAKITNSNSRLKAINAKLMVNN